MPLLVRRAFPTTDGIPNRRHNYFDSSPLATSSTTGTDDDSAVALSSHAAYQPQQRLTRPPPLLWLTTPSTKRGLPGYHCDPRHSPLRRYVASTTRTHTTIVHSARLARVISQRDTGHLLRYTSPIAVRGHGAHGTPAVPTRPPMTTLDDDDVDDDGLRRRLASGSS